MLKDLDKLFKFLILFNHHIFALSTLSLALFVAKYMKKDPQYIFKIVLKAELLYLYLLFFQKFYKNNFEKLSSWKYI